MYNENASNKINTQIWDEKLYNITDITGCISVFYNYFVIITVIIRVNSLHLIPLPQVFFEQHLVYLIGQHQL